MAKKNKNRGSTQKTQDEKEIRKDSKEKIKKKSVDDMAHKKGIKTTELQKRSFNQNLQGLADIFQSFRSIIISFIVLILILFMIFFGYRELSIDLVLIEPFEVPQLLEEQGYSGRVFAEKLIDRINHIRFISQIQMEKLKMMPVWSEQQVELEIPGQGISLSSIVQFIKRHLRHEPIYVVGEVVLQNDQIIVTVRIRGKPEITVPGKLEEIESISLQAAEHIYKYVYPYILASYLYEVDRKKSIEIIRYILSNEPRDDDSKALNLWGILLENEGDLDGAIKKYKESIEVDPKRSNVYVNWGMLLMNQGYYGDAVAKYKDAINHDPKNYEAYINWGVSLMRQGNYTEANSKLRKALKMKPRNEYAKVNLAEILVNEESYEDAIALCEEIIEINPEFWAAYYSWGRALANQGDIKSAIDKYGEAIELEPNRALTYEFLGMALRNNGNYDEAISKFKRGTEVNPSRLSCYKEWAYTLALQENYEDAIAKYKKIIELAPGGDWAVRAKNDIDRLKEKIKK